jgi:hypothetical protein
MLPHRFTEAFLLTLIVGSTDESAGVTKQLGKRPVQPYLELELEFYNQIHNV